MQITGQFQAWSIKSESYFTLLCKNSRELIKCVDKDMCLFSKADDTPDFCCGTFVAQQKLHVCHTLLQSLATNAQQKSELEPALFLCNLLRKR